MMLEYLQSTERLKILLYYKNQKRTCKMGESPCAMRATWAFQRYGKVYQMKDRNPTQKPIINN